MLKSSRITVTSISSFLQSKDFLSFHPLYLNNFFFQQFFFFAYFWRIKIFAVARERNAQEEKWIED